jgi:hypothetical protein
MVALFILSTLGIGAWHAAGVSLRQSTRLRSSLMSGARTLQLDDQLRSKVGRIIPPCWAPDQLVQVGENSLKVPYLDGDADKYLSLSYDKGILRIDDGESSIPYADFDGARFAAAADGPVQFGITVQLEKSGAPLTLTARFGGAAMSTLSSR